MSVIIPTHNRHDKLAETLALLRKQSVDADEYEIIVVDDGSTPPVVLDQRGPGPRFRLERTEGLERSSARNRGAAIAAGEVLIFVDDDMSVDCSFVDAHLRAHSDWPDALVVGGVCLPDDAMAKPFARFRKKLEQQETPCSRGVTATPNFCTAANMSIAKHEFRQFGGFDPSILSSEDQDLALRHTAHDGRIVFIPEANAVHRDDALDVRSYCRRAEWGMENMIPFCHRYPDWPDNIERELVNGPVRWTKDPVGRIARKLAKRCLTPKAILTPLFIVSSLLERLAPNSFLLDRAYRLLLGVHILRGYLAGLRRYNSVIKSGDPIARSVAPDTPVR